MFGKIPEGYYVIAELWCGYLNCSSISLEAYESFIFYKDFYMKL